MISLVLISILSNIIHDFMNCKVSTLLLGLLTIRLYLEHQIKMEEEYTTFKNIFLKSLYSPDYNFLFLLKKYRVLQHMVSNLLHNRTLLYNI